MIVGISGFAGAGKDTVGQYLVDYYDFERRSFANKMKQAIAALLDISDGMVDTLKKEDALIQIMRPAMSGRKTFRTLNQITMRQFLQRFGTEVGRDIFGEDFWLDQCLPINWDSDHRDARYIGKKIVLTDVRFENEFARISDLKGYNIWIETHEDTRAARGCNTELNHVSARRPDADWIDFTIINDGSLADLYAEVEDFLTFIWEKERHAG